MKSLPPGFVLAVRGPMRMYLRESHAEALLGIQVQRLSEWLGPHHWEAEAGGRGTLALRRPGLPDGSGLVIKGYRHGGLLGGLLGSRYLSPRRVLRAIEASDAARRGGVPVALVVVGAFERALPLGYRLFEASIQVLGAQPLHRALGFGLGPAPALARGLRSRRRLALEACARSVRALHDAGVDHRDLNLSNLLAADGPAGTEVYVVDFDSARVGAPLSPRRRLRALRRLYRSAIKLHPGRRPPPPLTQARWLRAYCAGDPRLRNYLLKHRRSFYQRARLHRILWKRPARLPDPA